MREIHVANITITTGDKKYTEEKRVRYIELGTKETLAWNKRGSKETDERGRGRNKSKSVNKSIIMFHILKTFTFCCTFDPHYLLKRN